MGDQMAYMNVAIRRKPQNVSKKLLDEAQLIREGTPSEYQLPIRVLTENKKSMTRKCAFGKDTGENTPSKTIMMVGATGAGKSTLVDGMVNHFVGVNFRSKFRFRLVSLMDDEKAKKGDQTLSQTEWITCYTLYRSHGNKIPFNLNIIDTPGFGDTRGIKRDKELMNQIKDLFTNDGPEAIETIHAVCFVIQAPLVRLTTQQKYVFDQVQSIFGKDIAENIFVLITFADGNEPPVLAALKEIVPQAKTFEFNNSALFADNSAGQRSNMSQKFWKMGNDSFENFFKFLTKVNPKSLKLTAEVLKEREHLEACLLGLQPEIKRGLSKLEEIRQEENILKQHEADLQTNKDFEYTLKVPKTRKVDIPAGTYITNCLVCNRTCHYPCRIPDDSCKRRCSAMNSNGYCNVCPQKCFWNQHRNMQFRYEDYEDTERRTFADLKDKYQQAGAAAGNQKGIIGAIQDDYRKSKEAVNKLIQEVHQNVKRLQEIALKDNPLSTIEYIDLLIDSEKSEAKPGFKERIQGLLEVRQDAVVLKEVMEKGTDFNPFAN